MTTVIRDAVWGDIELTEAEIAIVDTEAFQRLRRVRQLGFSDLVFPGAHHSRFEHSLGVLHVAKLVVEHLGRLAEAPAIDDESRRTFLAAAMLHDVGHYPFSHALEELEVEQIRRHEDIARDVICNGEVAGILTARWDVDPSRVASFVSGPPNPTEVDRMLRAALDADLDVDKLDYLVRDARAANVPYGVVDVQRLVGALTVWDGVPAVGAKGITALQSLVFAKHLMFATVYWHHACRAAVAMFLRGVQEALDAGAVGAAQIERADDAELVALLDSGDMPGITRTFAHRLRNRKLYKRAKEIGIDDDRFDELEQLWFKPDERRRLEDGWAGDEPGSVLLDIPEPKHIGVGLVVVDDGRASDWDAVSGLGTSDLERFQRWVRKIRVYASTAELASRLHLP